MKTDSEADNSRKPPPPLTYPPKTQALIEKYANNPNPEDTSGYLNQIVLHWVGGLIILGNKANWKQEVHPDISKDDDLNNNFPEIDELYTNNPEASLLKVLLKAYKGILIWASFMISIKCFAEGIIV